MGKMPQYPKNVAVIPIAFQADDVVAALLFRSDYTVTRSGGQTTMELLSIARGKIFIHSAAKKGNLMRGLPFWEGGNALYLQAKVGAELTTPTLFAQHFFNA